MILPLIGSPKGIIIGFDTSIVTVFRHSDSTEIKRIANNIAEKYDKVIIHLGRKYPFTKSYFADEICRRNLKMFCSIIHSHDVKIYMWMLDSYGSKNFIKLYNDYRNIVDDATGYLSELNICYDGIVTDMEWINHPDGKNNKLFIEIHKYIREKIGSRELLAFTPIIDNKNVNSRRGYDIKEIKEYADNVIAMLYVVNSDLCKCENNRIEPCLNDERINDLRRYFKRKNYQTAISLNQGIVVMDNKGSYVFSKPVKNEKDNIFNKLKLREKDVYRNYEVRLYKPVTDFEYTDENGLKESISPREDLYYIKLKKKILQKNDFIWEYSLADELE